MLEKLGQVLKKATDKLANAIFLDKNLVDSIIRDLQRALIEADVNVILVKSISDKIRKAAQDQRIKDIEKKSKLTERDVLVVAKVKAQNAVNKEPTAANLAALEKASKMLAELSGDGPDPAVKNRLEVKAKSCRRGVPESFSS